MTGGTRDSRHNRLFIEAVKSAKTVRSPVVQATVLVVFCWNIVFVLSADDRRVICPILRTVELRSTTC